MPYATFDYINYKRKFLRNCKINFEKGKKVSASSIDIFYWKSLEFKNTLLQIYIFKIFIENYIRNYIHKSKQKNILKLTCTYYVPESFQFLFKTDSNSLS